MKIGIVGSGQIGGLIGKLWSQAGHEVLFSSRHPQNLPAPPVLCGSADGLFMMT
jgi:predicted dinucleotide-binding enzyme